MLRSCQEDGCSRHTYYAAITEVVREAWKWAFHFAHSRSYGSRAAIPCPHRPMDRNRQKKWNVPAFCNFRQIGEEERTADHQEEGRDRPGSRQAQPQTSRMCGSLKSLHSVPRTRTCIDKNVGRCRKSAP